MAGGQLLLTYPLRVITHLTPNVAVFSSSIQRQTAALIQKTTFDIKYDAVRNLERKYQHVRKTSDTL